MYHFKPIPNRISTQKLNVSEQGEISINSEMSIINLYNPSYKKTSFESHRNVVQSIFCIVNLLLANRLEVSEGFFERLHVAISKMEHFKEKNTEQCQALQVAYRRALLCYQIKLITEDRQSYACNEITIKYYWQKLQSHLFSLGNKEPLKSHLPSQQEVEAMYNKEMNSVLMPCFTQAINNCGSQYHEFMEKQKWISINPVNVSSVSVDPSSVPLLAKN